MHNRRPVNELQQIRYLMPTTVMGVDRAIYQSELAF